jgi:pyruvate dehydrogenase E2 component (dihydrolipoamide acetyltransferase)
MINESKTYSGKKGFDILNTEHFGIQRKIVANMTTESWETIPHAAYIYEADVTEFMKEFKSLRASHSRKISFNTLMLKVIVEGIKRNPIVNSHIEYKRRLVRGKIETIRDINISMPMLLPGGDMMTINLHNFEEKSLDDMAAYIEDIRKRIEKTNLSQAMYEVSLDNTFRALSHLKIITTVGRLAGAKLGRHKIRTLSGKAKKEYKKIPASERLTKQDIEQGTITVSNLGSVYHGSSFGYPAMIEVIPPQVFAVAIGAVFEKPGIYVDQNNNKQIGPRKFLSMCFAFDHRALDYGDIVPFIARLDEIFENPAEIREW